MDFIGEAGWNLMKFAAGTIASGVNSAAAEREALPGNGGGAGYGNVILRSEHACAPGFLSVDEELSELILTDTNLILDIYVDKGVFNRHHRYEYLPLGEVMCENGVPCVRTEKKFLSNLRVYIEFKHSEQEIEFTTNPEANAKRWADAISNAVREISAASKRRRQSMSSGDSATNAPSGAKVVVGKCEGCHAPLSGATGRIVTCPYCDTKQTL
jgi:hypothetical protein